jgi:hypothetical protein
MLMFGSNGHLMIGLTKGNVEKLTAGLPASITGPRLMSVQTIRVVYGETKVEILAKLEAEGVEIADAIKKAAIEDPS